ncbi:xylulokinase [Cryptosporangium aurantiacum]|uniref:Xylulose kinase n=1 Tax=Cryptosporangium aurantiacum TaxID=134849 RepID=A0A1M7Q4K7_9ACTN|nr:xylulokinase [Cryptosporangium aurantiacum]SHN25245.1 xylulokinase [Cryptosporangium aurantiacum]
MALVAGVDCSTQSTKVLICDAETGAVVRQGRAPHPDATEVAPAVWWDALRSASDGLLDDVQALAVGGQQHGMVTLDANGEVVRPALLWNDTRSAGAATDLIDELGGAQPWVDAVGVVPVASFTVTKLRWLAANEPDEARRTERVVLPHDWLTWKLSTNADPTTDRGDASGTGYWSAATGEYRHDLLRRAFGRELGVPEVKKPDAIVGHTPDGIALAAGTGDNMAAALGLGAGPGDVVVSLGTSGTVFAVSESPTTDPSGYVAGFADATGRFLPLVCTLNAARVLTAAADLLGVDLDRLSELALASTPGAAGLTLLPYLDGERTPDLPDETGRLTGLTRANARPENLARAAVEGMLLGLADGLDAVRQHGVPVRRALLIGGAALSPAVRAVASGILGVPVDVPAPGEYVALGAARQAAWALSGAAEPPQWTVEAERAPEATEDYSGARDRYAQFRTGVQELSVRSNKS